MLGAVSQRLGRSVTVLLLVSMLVFTILHLAPGDPAVLLVGGSGTDADIAAVRHQMGFDAGLPTQLWRFLVALAHGNLGNSFVFQKPVTELLGQALPQTLLLGAAAFAVSLVVALPAGVWGALRPGSLADQTINLMVAVTQALPTFWIGIMLIQLVAVQLRWLPTSGNATWGSLVLPSLTLAAYQIPMLTHTVRAAMREVLGEDFIRTARAKGLLPGRIVVRHAFRNVLTPVLTVTALQLGATLSGAVLTEAVFAWPGLGTLAMTAVMSRDYPVVQGVVLCSAALVVGLNTAADAAIVLLDPRRRPQ